MLTAGVVIATCDPRTTAKLTTPGGIERRLMERIRHAPANRSNSGPSLLNLAMSRKISLRRHQELRRDGADLNLACGIIGSAQTVRDSFVAARRGLIPALPCFSVSPMSNWDPSQAPAGQGTAYIYLPATPVETLDGASHRQMIGPVLREAAQYYDGIDSEIGRWFESCPERAVRLNVTNGCVVHVDFGSYRSGTKRPAVGLGGTASLVPGLFLGGAGSHPGGGVSGMPGKIAAERVARYLKA
jgi:phytoene dehydrogenase-like protein